MTVLLWGERILVRGLKLVIVGARYRGQHTLWGERILVRGLKPFSIEEASTVTISIFGANESSSGD